MATKEPYDGWFIDHIYEYISLASLVPYAQRNATRALWIKLAELIRVPEVFRDLALKDRREGVWSRTVIEQLVRLRCPEPEPYDPAELSATLQQLLSAFPKQARQTMLLAIPSIHKLAGDLTYLNQHLHQLGQASRREEERSTRFGMADRSVYVRRSFSTSRPPKLPLPFALEEPVSLEEVIRVTKVSRKTANEWRAEAYNPNRGYMDGAGFSYGGEQYTINLA